MNDPALDAFYFEQAADGLLFREITTAVLISAISSEMFSICWETGPTGDEVQREVVIAQGQSTDNLPPYKASLWLTNDPKADSFGFTVDTPTYLGWGSNTIGSTLYWTVSCW